MRQQAQQLAYAEEMSNCRLAATRSDPAQQQQPDRKVHINKLFKLAIGRSAQQTITTYNLAGERPMDRTSDRTKISRRRAGQPRRQGTKERTADKNCL